MKRGYEPKTVTQKVGYLVEECGEVLAAAGKAIRWGLEGFNPELPETDGNLVNGGRETNRHWLLRELHDLERAISIVRAEIGTECETCRGAGYISGHQNMACGRCGGTGKPIARERTPSLCAETAAEPTPREPQVGDVWRDDDDQHWTFNGIRGPFGWHGCRADGVLRMWPTFEFTDGTLTFVRRAASGTPGDAK